jgi:PAS domain S-box-containing protein
MSHLEAPPPPIHAGTFLQLIASCCSLPANLLEPAEFDRRVKDHICTELCLVAEIYHYHSESHRYHPYRPGAAATPAASPLLLQDLDANDLPEIRERGEKRTRLLLPFGQSQIPSALLAVTGDDDRLIPEGIDAGLTALVAALGTSFDNLAALHQLQQVQQQAQQADLLRQALYDINETAHSATSEQDLYLGLHRIVARLINAANFLIALRAERQDGQYIRFVYYCDEFDSALQGTEVRIDPTTPLSMSAYVMQCGRPLLLQPEDYDHFCRDNNLKPLGQRAFSLIGVPFRGENLTGVVIVQSYRETRYNEQDRELLAYVARHIGDALSRKKVLDEMRETNEIFSLFLRYSPVHVYIKEVCDTGSRLLRMSRAYAASLDNSIPEKLIGKSMEELFPPEFAAKTSADDRRVVSGGTPLQTEEHLNGKTYSTIKFPIHQGGKTLLAGYSIDITERRQMLETLQENERRYRILFERSPLAMVSFDSSGTIIDCNEKFVEMMGSSRDKLIGFHSAGKSSPKMRQTIAKALAGKTAYYEDAYVSITGGKSSFLRGFFSPVSPGRTPTDVIAILEDITERRKDEEERQKIEKLSSLGVLAGGIAHDFNNILTGIMGNVSFVQALLNDEHQGQEPLTEATKAAKKAGELAGQLLTFAKGGEPDKKVVRLAELLHDAVSLSLGGAKVRPAITLDPELSAIRADKAQLMQVLNNLIINACQAMPNGGVLSIVGRNEQNAKGNPLGLAAGHYVRLEFHDQGCGIAEEHLAKIFDPYYSTKAGGTGLGLAAAYSIVKRHQGRIEVQSQEGSGTTFIIHLPAAVEAGPVQKEIRKPHLTSDGGHILVMDDDRMIRDLAMAMLRHLGYTVVSCADGEEAVVLYKEAMRQGNPFQAVILDLTIPGGLGGKETAEQLLACDPTAWLIVSSGYSNDPIMADYQAFGFSGAIAKPYTMEEFQAVLNCRPPRVSPQ